MEPLRYHLISLLVFFGCAANAFASSVNLQTFRTHSRLSIVLDPSIEPKWKEVSGTGFILTLQGLTLQDLYLKEGESAQRDARLKSLEFSDEEGAVVVKGQWNFPTGDLAPSDPVMERFQYREKNPSKLVIDFWAKAGPTVGDLKKLKVKKVRLNLIQAAENAAARRQKKREIAQKSLAIQEDVGRFCQEPFKEGLDIFLPFYPLHQPFEFSKYIPEGNPDDGYQYIDPKVGTDDAKYVTLALDLHQNRKHALAIKTIDLFEKEQPKSIYRVDMKFLRANALRKLGMKESADRLFEEIREKEAGTPAALYSALHLANQMRLSGNHLQTIERYLWISQNYPQHRLNWVFHMAAAEALYSLKQSDRAAKEYEWIAENAPDSESKAQGELRIGDAYLVRFQYDRALAAYYKAIEKYRDLMNQTASVQMNRAEALYWLGQLDRAEEAYASFRDKFSSNPAGWRATLRLGEIVGRKPGPESIVLARKYFLETVNGFPFSPGSTLARMRLIPCGNHAGFTATTAKEFFEKEAQEYTGNSEVSMDQFKELRAMLRVRSLILFDQMVAAIDASIQEKEDLSSKSAVARWIGDMERQLFRKNIVALLDAGKNFDAIQFYDKRASKISIIDDSDEIESGKAATDPDYLLRLSRAASNIGLGSLAGKISSQYDVASAQFAISRGIANAESKEDSDYKLKKSEKLFTQAKALWIVNPVNNSAPVRELLSQVIDESPYSYQKEIILGLIAEKEGKLTTSIGHASRAKLLLPFGVMDKEMGYAVIDQWIAKLQADSGNTHAAIDSYRKLQTGAPEKGNAEKITNLGLASLDPKETWIITEGELLAKLGKWGEAAAAYGKAVDNGLGGNRAGYEYATALSKASKDPDEVRKQFEKVAKSETNDFWKELARKALAGINAKEGNGNE